MQEDGVGGAALGGTTAKKRGGREGKGAFAMFDWFCGGRRKKEEGGTNGSNLGQRRGG